MSEGILLSVIIPAYNEKANFQAGILDQIDRYLSSEKFKYEVILVDDGSTDGSAEQIGKWIKTKPHWTLIKNSHAGKAKTVATGMLAAAGKIRLFTDFDQATPISEVTKVIKKYHEGYQVIIGSREAKGARREQEPKLRHIMGRVFNLVVQILAVRGISDTQCGFKAFTAEATIDLFNRMVIYRNRRVADAYTGAFDVELLFLARKSGYKIVQIPVIWHYVTTTRVNPLKDSLRMFIDVIKIRMTYMFTGKYKSKNPAANH